MADHIHTVNALKVRNQFGEVLELLERDGCPILVSKGRKVRAVLITPEDFKSRFVDRLADDARQRMLETIRSSREAVLSGDQVDEALRSLRGELR
jgi:PHD/YefM family antitoxin component YafN of YafNO toxin-antitoxin module